MADSVGERTLVGASFRTSAGNPSLTSRWIERPVNKSGPGLRLVVVVITRCRGSNFGGRTLPWNRSSSIRRFILHAQSGITPTLAALARSGQGPAGARDSKLSHAL